MKTKIIAAYLPQFHQIPENDEWWGKGFTDWIAVKQSIPLYPKHLQPRIPIDEHYYDLSDAEEIKCQINLAKRYGVDGFYVYHYWFSSEKKLLTKPLELILENKNIDMPFFFAWDNASWIRTWSKLEKNGNAWVYEKNAGKKDNKSSVLALLDYGKEEDWRIHFEYLNRFFKDSRYMKIDNKPIFIIWNYQKKAQLYDMCKYWRKIAPEYGFEDIFLISRDNPYDGLEGFDALFTYEPSFTAWQRRSVFYKMYNRIKVRYLNADGIQFFDYDNLWKKIIKYEKKQWNKKVYTGGFVQYDDSPRRGMKAKIVKNSSPDKFEKYLTEALQISNENNKEFFFLTAWNEWGESAYLEPDEMNGYGYLEALKKAKESVRCSGYSKKDIEKSTMWKS